MPRTKLRQDFEINYPLDRRVIEDLKFTIKNNGELVITGTAYCDPSVMKAEVNDRYSFDIDFIKYNGVDIKPVLEALDAIHPIDEYCFKVICGLFSENERRTA